MNLGVDERQKKMQMDSDSQLGTSVGARILVAVSRNGVIGNEQALPWHLRSDLQRFKRTTMGHTLVMGRKTFESIGRPLPGRRTIVLSRSGFQSNDVVVVDSWEAALQHTPENQIPFVVGGAEIYRLAIPYVQEILLTRVLVSVQGDAFWPGFDVERFRCVELETLPADARNDWPTQFERWVREPNVEKES